MKKKLTQPELLEMLLEKEGKEIRKMDEMVDLLIAKNVTINVNAERDEDRSLPEKMSDGLAKFAGSWRFIMIFGAILAFWIFTNIKLLSNPFDPFPFILLNLILSCIAAIQAPIIMMSQNRQEKKDRMRSDNDYKIDLKAEFILEDMYNKLNKLIEAQEKTKLEVREMKEKIK
jgi:uncharacterized membrane protein